MRREPVIWLASLGGALALAAEWMRSPGWVLAVGVAALAVTALWAARRVLGQRGVRLVVAGGAAASLALAALLAATTWRLGRVERAWPAVSAALDAGATRRLEREVAAAVALVSGLADGAARLQALAPEEAFERLGRLSGRSGPAHGVVLFDPQGRPIAWAGTLRVAVGPDGPALSVVTTPFYLWLVARRQVNGAAGVATVLLARSLGVPLAAEAVTERFLDATGVGLRFLGPGALPPDSAVIDFVGPDGDTLFAVQGVLPSRDEVRADLTAGALRVALALAGLVLLLGMVGAARLESGLALASVNAAAAAVLVARAPLAEAFGQAGVFGPATYSRALLGPFSASAGALALTAVVVATLALALWRRGLRPRWWMYGAAVILVGVAPYLLQDLAAGIHPPAAGTTVALWMTWQLALALVASALVLVGAALVRGPAPPPHGGLWPWVAAGLALALGVAGLWLWVPGAAWPDWYPYLWLPLLLVGIKPMPLRSTLATVAVVAGTAAALLSWRATVDGQVAVATSDATRLGPAPDGEAIALTEQAAEEALLAPLPAGPGDLYVLYRRSPLGGGEFPVALALWTGEGEPLAALDLAALDLPAAIVQSLAREAAAVGAPMGASYLRVPGAHLVAAVPLADGRVLTLVVGPRTRLVPPTRIGRFLAGGREAEPPYRIAISPPEPAPTSPPARVRWRRAGWSLRGERLLMLPGGARHVRVQVDLRGPTAVLQRGLLVLLFDVAALALLWLGIEAAGGRLVPAVRARWPRASRSLRLRLTLGLALFFVVPAVAAAAWSWSRLGDEFRRTRESLLRQTLRDAGGVLGPDVRDPGAALATLARRVDADLTLLQDGRLVAVSATVLSDLGLVDLFVPPAAYRRLAFGDDLDVTLRQEASLGDVLAGYRVVRGGAAANPVILGAVELVSDAARARREQDLGIATLVAAALGLLAAIVLSGIAARALAEPIRQLRAAALAVGAGEGPGVRPEHLPGELDPVYGALQQAAADVERAQRAERVLAWGEMARQVAHEIKNPLTPIRLGIQHLVRVHRERPEELGASLEGSGPRLLSEIDRLDAIARTFSRFALPAAEGPALEAVDLSAAVAEVVNLYRLGESPVAWRAETQGAPVVQARRDELVEVLVNLFENARDAGARSVTATVRARPDGGADLVIADDGRGIAADLLSRVFEPRFSTTSSGSGLGLAIVKRLVEGWGGSVALASVAGEGTTVTVRLVSASSRGRDPAPHQ